MYFTKHLVYLCILLYDKMVKSDIFDNSRMLDKHKNIPHYNEDIVCFESCFCNRNYPKDHAYFNRELYLILILEGESEILLNGEHIFMNAGTALIHGANFLTSHLTQSENIRFITLSVSNNMLTNDSYLTQTTALVLATLRQNRQHTISLTRKEADTLENGLRKLMILLQSDHRFMFRRVQASCNAIFLDIADFLARKTIIKKNLSAKEHVLQDFYMLVTRHFREEHFISFYASKLAISDQYLSRIVREGTGKTVNDIISELITMEARMLLSNRKFTVNEISSQLTFSDASGFCKFFKRNTGQTPLEYRKSNWQKITIHR